VAIMDTFDHLLNWKLKVGSHPFPGPNGGTCINEAALVAAGFEYQAIHSVEHMPECFSRPICRFAMRLNDEANDEDRQRLLPFETRQSCADSPEVEERRAAYINRHAAKCVVNLHLYGRTALDFDKALVVLQGALAIGRQADAFEPDEVLTRMDKARAGKGKATRTAAPVPAGDKPFFSKAKSWLATKVSEPAD
jgi:hypothetical protein